MIKALLIGYVIADNSSNCVSVVPPGDRLKALLPRLSQSYRMYCVPYLQFDTVATHIDSLGPEFNPDRNLMLISIAFIGILKQQARFAHT